MCLVADYVPVKHVLSGVCDVTMHASCCRFCSCRVCSVRCLCCTRPWSTCSVTMMHMSCCRFCSCEACSVWYLQCHNVSCCRFCSCQACSVWYLQCHNVSCCRFCFCRACSVRCSLRHNDGRVLFQVLFLSSMFCLVFITSQRWTCLVSGSVLVKHVLSGVHYVTTMDVSCFRFCSCQACSVWCSLRHNDGRVLFQVLFLSSMFCLVFITSQRWTCLVSGSVLVKHVLSGVHYVTTMDVSCCRFCSCQACSVWCSLWCL